MIIGTAGHVDHGKTALVRALTGVDTDRLPEEKARGISIALGYAYQATPEGAVLGYVDVPGHERFIHTMLAGATGIDFALLVVAADDGIMPQTVEHLQILGLLGLGRGAVALTKVDRVAESRVAEVADELRVRLGDSSLAGSPVFPVSALTGAGVAQLRAHLEAAAGEHGGAAAPAGHFRLAVDRSFTLGGLGTVVTGTVHAGAARTGDQLVLTPAGRPVRVRSIHANERPSAVALAGQRCALNLAGVTRDEVARGDWVVAAALHAPTARLDVRLQLLPHSPALVSWSPLHVHLGAAHRMGRVVPLEGQTLAPGTAALAQIVLDQPIGALQGDRFIVRDADASRTLGGGIVIDPVAPERHRRAPGRLAALRALDQADHVQALAACLALDGHDVDLAAFCRSRNIVPATLPVPAKVRVVTAAEGRWAFAGGRWAALRAQVLQGLADFHHDHPDEMGPDPARLRRMFLGRLAPPVAAALVEELVDGGLLRRSGPWLHLPGHDLALGPADEALAARLLPLVAAGGSDPPWVRDIARALGAPEDTVRQLLLRLTRRGDVFQVVRDLFYGRDAIAALACIAGDIEAADGEVRAAAFRDRSGVGRKRAVQILEFFDRVGYTRRVRDWHRVRSDNLLHIAAAAAPAARNTAPQASPTM